MLHIDGDIIAYRIACAVDDDATEAHVRANVDSFICLRCLVPFPELTPYQVYLTQSPDVDNFRHKAAVTGKYKGFRGSKPPMLPVVRQHLIDYWDAVIAEPGIECDDAIAMAVTLAQAKGSTTEVILSLDKDFDQIPCERYDFVKKTTTHPDPMEAVRNLYAQILEGDRVDNIIGAEGWGPGASADVIDKLETELDMWSVCVDQLGYERAFENGCLVYLLRSKTDSFTHPLGEIYEWTYSESTEADVSEAMSD